MTSVDTARDVAVLWTLDFDAELPCESNLHNLGRCHCSGPAKFIVISACGLDRAVCESAGIYIKAAIARNDKRCVHCEGNYSECWSIRPI